MRHYFFLTAALFVVACRDTSKEGVSVVSVDSSVGSARIETPDSATMFLEVKKRVTEGEDAKYFVDVAVVRPHQSIEENLSTQSIPSASFGQIGDCARKLLRVPRHSTADCTTKNAGVSFSQGSGYLSIEMLVTRRDITLPDSSLPSIVAQLAKVERMLK